MRGEVIPPQPGREEPTPGRFVVALLLFVLLAATCLLLLLAALVFWLATLTGSMAAAAPSHLSSMAPARRKSPMRGL